MFIKGERSKFQNAQLVIPVAIFLVFFLIKGL